MSSRVSLREPKQASPLKVVATSDAWADQDEADEAAFKRLSAVEAQHLRELNPPLSPWRVIALQAALGVLIVWVARWWTGQAAGAWSAAYGVAAAVIPGALAAHGLTQRPRHRSPTLSLVSILSWEAVKMTVSVAMLLLAPKLVAGLNWPALLVALVLCIKGYWVALSWRGRRNGGWGFEQHGS